MKRQLLFEERQRFNIWLIIIVGITTTGIFLLGLFCQLVLKKDFGNNPMSNEALVIALILCLTGNFFLARMRLETQIWSDGIVYRFFPFHLIWRSLYWEDIEQVSVRKYDALFEYGGWGIKGFADDRVLNTQGDDGIQLVLKNRKKLLIGTQRPEEVKEILATLSL